MRLLAVWLINAVSLMLIPHVIHSIQITDFYTAMITALFLGLVNTLIRPLLVFITLPATVLTLGLFILVINGLLFLFVSSFVKGFYVAGFGAAFWGALAYSIISWLASSLLLRERLR